EAGQPEEPVAHAHEPPPDERFDPEAEPDPDRTTAMIDQLEAERDAYRDKYLRALADHQNAHRRALANEREAREQGIRDVVTALLAPLDHFDLALAQDPASATAEQIIAGVRVIRDEIMRVLQSYGVGTIVPERGDEFVPTRHEAILLQPADDVPPGHIVGMLQPGYTLGERV